jgi:Na+/H+ antiporter NhaD/arsenite permease-like protein
MPALLVYLAVLFTCFRVTKRVMQRTKDDPQHRQAYETAVCVRLMLISYCVSSAFLTHAYLFYVPTLAALCGGLSYWLENQAQPAAPPMAAAAAAGVHAGARGFARSVSAR